MHPTSINVRILLFFRFLFLSYAHLKNARLFDAMKYIAKWNHSNTLWERVGGRLSEKQKLNSSHFAVCYMRIELFYDYLTMSYIFTAIPQIMRWQVFPSNSTLFSFRCSLLFFSFPLFTPLFLWLSLCILSPLIVAAG